MEKVPAQLIQTYPILVLIAAQYFSVKTCHPLCGQPLLMDIQV